MLRSLILCSAMICLAWIPQVTAQEVDSPTLEELFIHPNMSPEEAELYRNMIRRVEDSTFEVRFFGGSSGSQACDRSCVDRHAALQLNRSGLQRRLNRGATVLELRVLNQPVTLDTLRPLTRGELLHEMVNEWLGQHVHADPDAPAPVMSSSGEWRFREASLWQLVPQVAEFKATQITTPRHGQLTLVVGFDAGDLPVYVHTFQEDGGRYTSHGVAASFCDEEVANLSFCDEGDCHGFRVIN